MERSGEEVVKEGKDGERERETHREMQIKTYQQQG